MVLTFLPGKAEGFNDVKMGISNVPYKRKVKLVTKFGE